METPHTEIETHDIGMVTKYEPGSLWSFTFN